MKIYLASFVIVTVGCALEATEQRRIDPKDADLLADMDSENDGCSELALHVDHASCDAVEAEEVRRGESEDGSHSEEDDGHDADGRNGSQGGDSDTESNLDAGDEDDRTPPAAEPDGEDDVVDDEGMVDVDPPADPNIVEFRIASGTGSGAWNTQATMIVARVGQTIRFINDDTQRHRLHTNGSPCPHGSAFGAGESFDCVVTSAYDAVARGALYDHGAGRSAEVWITTTQ